MKYLILLFPFVGLLLIVLIILTIFSVLFGSEKGFYQSNFVLPFDTINYKITSPYGERIHPVTGEKSFHSGIDVVPTSNNIVAIADGTVVVSDIGETSGEHVIIEHKVSGQVYRSVYYHLRENSRIVKVGDVVKQGQQIGIMGSTGRVTAAHLHFELYKYNVYTQEFVRTDPSIVINNKVSAKEYILFDYNNSKNEVGLPEYNAPILPSYKK